MTTTLQLGPREAQVHGMFLRKAKRSLSELSVIYQDTYAPGVPLRVLTKNLTSVIFTLNAKLEAAKKGKIERISARGRGHAGLYQLKRR